MTADPARPDAAPQFEDAEPEWRALGCARRSCSKGEHSLVWGDCALAEEPPPDTTTLVGRVYTAEDGYNSTAIYRTHLHWPEHIGSNTETGTVDLPICDDDGNDLGAIELTKDRARVLAARLADAVVVDPPVYRNPVVRMPLDSLNDDRLDQLYDRLEVAEQFLAALTMRGNPETWQRQADEIGRLLGRLDEQPRQIAYRIRAELVCCHAYDGGDPDADGVHQICYWGEAAARIAEGRDDEEDDYLARVTAAPSPEVLEAARQILHSDQPPRRRVRIDGDTPKDPT